jgi:hypothetical protein
MNSMERYHALVNYGNRDRLFHWEMGPYAETIKRWQKEGLPDSDNWYFYGGYDRFEHAPVHVGLLPGFEAESLEITDEYEIYRDADGVIKRKIRNLPPPAMPQYLEYPLKKRSQWPDWKRRLNPESPARFAPHWESRKRDYQQRDYVLGISCGSLYGWLRNWMGVEGISYCLFDDRAFLEMAAEDIADCVVGVLDKALDGVSYDCAVFWEDMAYKTASLIDPRDYRQIFLPHYARITDRLHRAGITAIMLDSDGNVDELIPCWLDVGINFIYPMEVAAGMEVVQLRKNFGKDLLIAGGMDKRILASDRESIREMVEEKIPLMQEGGYVPGCDHAMPPDIPWENYIYYRELLAKVHV